MLNDYSQTVPHRVIFIGILIMTVCFCLFKHLYIFVFLRAYFPISCSELQRQFGLALNTLIRLESINAVTFYPQEI